MTTTDLFTPIIGAAGLAVAFRKAVLIMGIVKELFAIFSALVFIVAGLEGGTTTGPEKRAAAITAIRKILDDSTQPLTFPKFLAPWEDMLLGLAVDGAVAIANRTGFFGKSSAPLSSP